MKSFAVNDWSTYVGSLAEVSDPKVRNAAAAQTFTDVLTYPAWLQMGDKPGTFVSRCYGRKVFRFEAMPAAWRSFFAWKFPTAAADAGALVRA